MSTSTIDMADLIGGNSKKKQKQINEKNKNEGKSKEINIEKKIVNKKENDLSEIAYKDNDAK